MKTKLLYVVVSNESDTYFEMMIMSAFSAKARMSECHICLLMDNNTNDIMSANRRNLVKEYIDETVIVTFDDSLNAKRRSRYLKTNMRNHVDGDFLYIDSDTVIMQSLDEIDDFDFELGAVLDGHTTIQNHHYNWIVKRETGLYGYDIEDSGLYFNGGVLYVKDTKNTRDFFEKWHSLYKKKINLIDQDQPSLNYLNKQYHSIFEMPAEYNLQLIVGMHHLYKTKILHFFSNTDKPLLEISSEGFLQYVKTHGLTKKVQQKILNPLSTFLPYTTLVRNEDFFFVYSKDYALYRRVLFHGHQSHEHYRMGEKIFYIINRTLLKFEYVVLKIVNKL